jgi:uncharacterized protein (DUF433 family)
MTRETKTPTKDDIGADYDIHRGVRGKYYEGYRPGANKEVAMTQTTERTEHPHITSQKGFCGGSPVIRGTKFPVRSVVSYVLRQGLPPEELVREFSHLTLAQVYDALSYYYDHKQEIDQELVQNTEEGWRADRGG